MSIKKGDTVKILGGKDRGRTGAVIKVFASDNRVTVEGVNLYKKRSRPKNRGQKGETVMVASPLPASKVMLICKNCRRAARVGHRVEGNQKIRYCKKCQAET